MSNGTMIVKRDGSKENLNIDKIHVVVEHACKGLAGVSSSQIEMNANLQFYDGMSTKEIQEVLIRSGIFLGFFRFFEVFLGFRIQVKFRSS